MSIVKKRKKSIKAEIGDTPAKSSNEKLQSTNEELDTSREELQSINEELMTLNGELSAKTEMLTRANDDLKNYLDRTDIAILFLDMELNIHSFTPATTDVFNIRSIDIGRPFKEITSRLAYKGLIKDSREVLRNMAPKEMEVQRRDGHWYSMRIQPYLTVQNALGGLVLSFLDIDKQKQSAQELASVNSQLQKALEEQQKAKIEKEALLQESSERLNDLQTLLDNVPVAVWIARDPECLNITGNIYANRLFGVRAGENISKSAPSDKIAGSYKVVCNSKELKPQELPAQVAAARGKSVAPYGMDLVFDDGRRLNILIGAEPLIDTKGKVKGSISVAMDITERKKAEEQIAFQADVWKNMHDAVIATDAFFKITAWNNSATEVYGWTAEEVIGKNSRDILRSPITETQLKELLSELAEKGRVTYLTTQRTKDGRVLEIEAKLVTLKDDSGQITGYISANRDITKRKKAEDELKTSEEKYRSLFTNMTEGFALCEIITESAGKPVDYRIVEVNQAWEEQTGLSAVQVNGKAIKELIPDLEQYWVDSYGKVALTGEPLHLENYNKFTNRWYEIYAYSPRKGYFVTLVQNISERKKSEEALMESESRFRSVLNNSLDVIYRFNIQTGRYEYMSPAIRRMGFEPEEMTAMTNKEVFSRVHPDDLPDLQRGLTALAEKGIGYAEYRFMNKSSIYKWWANQMVITNDEMGKPLYRDGYVRDITERKQAEEALRETRDYLDNLFNYANAPIIVWDSEFKVTRFNHAFERLTGRTANEVVGNKLDLLFPDENRKASMEIIRQTQPGERWEVVEIPIFNLDGTIHTVLWNSATVYSANGQTAIATIAQGQDITERKKAEEAVQRYTLELETYRNHLEDMVNQRTQELQSLSRRLISLQEEERRDISRELHDQTGQSLTVLNMLLAKSLRSPETSQSDVKEAQQLVKEVLSQVRALSSSLHPGMLEDLGLLPTLEWYLNDFGKKTGIKVKFDYSELNRNLPGEFNITIYRVIQESLTNIARYAEVKEATVSLTLENQSLSILIEDKGKGFAVESQPQGVGLRGMRERVNSLKGTLRIHSVPREGTLIEAELPVPNG
jgi:PAS domain S-box-containing protein